LSEADAADCAYCGAIVDGVDPVTQDTWTPLGRWCCGSPELPGRTVFQTAAVSIVREAGDAVESVFTTAKLYLWMLGVFALVVVLVAFVIISHGNPVADGAAPSLGLAGVSAAAAAVWKWFDLSRFQKKTKDNLEQKKDDISKQSSSTEGEQGDEYDRS
jgi:hypothetical protein